MSCVGVRDLNDDAGCGQSLISKIIIREKVKEQNKVEIGKYHIHVLQSHYGAFGWNEHVAIGYGNI